MFTNFISKYKVSYNAKPLHAIQTISFKMSDMAASKAPSTKVSMTAAEMVKATLVERAAYTKVSMTPTKIVKSQVVDKAVSNAVDTKVVTEMY